MLNTQTCSVECNPQSMFVVLHVKESASLLGECYKISEHKGQELAIKDTNCIRQEKCCNEFA